MVELLAVYGAGLALLFYMAWGLGANDAANPTECAVGSGAISMRRAITLFAIFAALGGIVLGPFVMKTLDRGIVDRTALDAGMLVVGSITIALAAVLWLTFCSWIGMPVSTTHSAVGGVLGFGLIAAPHLLVWDKIQIFAISIAASPVLSLALASGLLFALGRYFRGGSSGRAGLALIFSLILTLSFATLATVLLKTLKWQDPIQIAAVGLAASLTISTLATVGFLKRHKQFGSEQLLAYFLVISLSFSAFAFGANDMANATGVFVTPTQALAGTPPGFGTMVLLALLGSAGIAIGGFTLGHRVLRTTAYRITRLDPLAGAAAEFSNALTVFLFTTIPALLTGFGVPISTTHSSVGSIIGVGLARGLRGIHKSTTGKILAFWVLTIPAAAAISAALFKVVWALVA